MSKLFIVFISLSSYSLIAQNIKAKSHAAYIVFDNDILKPKNRTDQYYSFGQFLGYYQSVSHKSKVFNKIFSPFQIDGKYVFRSELSLKGYTPIEGNTGIIDRPFAGILTVNSSFTNVTPNEYLSLSIEVGVRGPKSGAEKFQNSIHRLLSNEELVGWDTQLPTKGLVNIYGKWSKSIFVTQFLDFIPEAGLAIGNNQTYIQPNLQARLGWFNSLDNTGFYQTNVGSATNVKDEAEAYLLFQLYGRLSIVDATIKGKEIDNSIEAFDKNNLLAGFSMQVHINFHKVDTFFGYHKQSPVSDLVPTHSYGTLGIMYRW